MSGVCETGVCWGSLRIFNGWDAGSIGSMGLVYLYPHLP